MMDDFGSTKGFFIRCSYGFEKEFHKTLVPVRHENLPTWLVFWYSFVVLCIVSDISVLWLNITLIASISRGLIKVAFFQPIWA